MFLLSQSRQLSRNLSLSQIVLRPLFAGMPALPRAYSQFRSAFLSYSAELSVEAVQNRSFSCDLRSFKADVSSCSLEYDACVLADKSPCAKRYNYER